MAAAATGVFFAVFAPRTATAGGGVSTVGLAFTTARTGSGVGSTGAAFARLVVVRVARFGGSPVGTGPPRAVRFGRSSGSGAGSARIGADSICTGAFAVPAGDRRRRAGVATFTSGDGSSGATSDGGGASMAT